RVMMLRTLQAAMCGDADTLDPLAREDNPAFLQPGIAALQGLRAAAVGRWEEVDAVLARWDATPGMPVSYWAPFRPLLQARLALHEGCPHEALPLLRAAVLTSFQIDRMGLDTMIRIALAVAEHRAGSREAAWRAVAPVVEQVARTEDIGGVLLCGADLLSILADAPW